MPKTLQSMLNFVPILGILGLSNRGPCATMTAADYQTLIDPRTWQFIHETEAFYPADSGSLPLADQRAIYDRMARHFHRGYPTGIIARDAEIAGVPCRIFAGRAPRVVYFHGGSFIFGGMDSHDDICAEICAATGQEVVLVNYRLSPEHLHPAALLDALAVTRALIHDAPVVLAGDSAGGMLAASVAHVMRGEAAILGQVLVYPGLGGDHAKGSFQTHAFAPMLTLAEVELFQSIRQVATSTDDALNIVPLQDRDFSGLPVTVAFAAECDPLADDCANYATAINDAGGRAVAFTGKGLVHGYLRARASVPEARASFEMICAAVAALAAGEWPYGDRK